MLPQEFIRVKRDGLKHTRESMDEFFRAYLSGQVADYQVTAWLMAAFLRGLDEEETFWLTRCIIDSGQTVPLADIPGVKIDKHSSGGVGDKVSLAIVPLLASAGLVVSKMSGRGLGHTGGTIDKLESIPGLRTELTIDEFKSVLRRIGAAIVAQSEALAPLDKRLYSLRDVTSTVESLPLIASSIMSKKLAVGSDLVSLDVKVGNGAFIKTPEDAVKLSQIMVSLGKQYGRRVIAHVTDMNEPLGRSVGNTLEVIEAIEFLKGGDGGRFGRLVSELFDHTMAALSLKGPMLQDLIASGKALEKFALMVAAQGGNPGIIEDYSLMPMAPYSVELLAEDSGYIEFTNTAEVGLAVVELGGGRKKKEDTIDHGVGVIFHKEGGSKVEKDEPIATVYYRNENTLAAAMNRLRRALRITPNPTHERPLIWSVVE